MWGIFCINKVLHVVPVTENGKPKQPHMPHEFCICDPEIVTETNQAIVIHKEES